MRATDCKAFLQQGCRKGVGGGGSSGSQGSSGTVKATICPKVIRPWNLPCRPSSKGPWTVVRVHSVLYIRARGALGRHGSFVKGACFCSKVSDASQNVVFTCCRQRFGCLSSLLYEPIPAPETPDWSQATRTSVSERDGGTDH